MSEEFTEHGSGDVEVLVEYTRTRYVREAEVGNVWVPLSVTGGGPEAVEQYVLGLKERETKLEYSDVDDEEVEFDYAESDRVRTRNT